jgi:hypothetical protein
MQNKKFRRNSPPSLSFNAYRPVDYTGVGGYWWGQYSMSIVRRNKNGFGCEHLDVEDRDDAVPPGKALPVPRPPDLDLYSKALSMGWPIGPDVKADTIARLHAVVKYVNDPRAVIKAGKTLVEAEATNLQALSLAKSMREYEDKGGHYQPPSERRAVARDLARRERAGEEVDWQWVLEDDVARDAFFAEYRRMNQEAGLIDDSDQAEAD